MLVFLIFPDQNLFFSNSVCESPYRLKSLYKEPIEPFLNTFIVPAIPLMLLRIDKNRIAKKNTNVL